MVVVLPSGRPSRIVRSDEREDEADCRSYQPLKRLDSAGSPRMMIGVDKALHPTSAVQLDGHLRERKQLSTGLLGRRLTARVLQVPRGQFDAGAIVPDPDEWLGVLVLDGLIAAGVDAGRAHTTWLVGSDDLVRPWNMREFSLIQNPTWR